MNVNLSAKKCSGKAAMAATVPTPMKCLALKAVFHAFIV